MDQTMLLQTRGKFKYVLRNGSKAEKSEDDEVFSLNGRKQNSCRETFCSKKLSQRK